MTLVRFDPFAGFASFSPFAGRRELDRYFESPAQRTTGTWRPRVDVYQEDAAIVVRAEIPGVSPDDVDVTVDDRRLTISGTRSFEAKNNGKGTHRREIFEGNFARTLVLPEGTDPEAVTATSKDGILEITVPKQPEVLPHTVTVDVAS